MPARPAVGYRRWWLHHLYNDGRTAAPIRRVDMFAKYQGLRTLTEDVTPEVTG